MNELRLGLTGGRTAYAPGEKLEGAAGWRLEAPATQIELRLFWFTKGKGSQDVGVENSLVFDHPAAEEARPFSFTLPAGPYSFSGQLISLVWALELIATPSLDNTRTELVVAPHAREVLLHPA